jgi:hypothetical protein
LEGVVQAAKNKAVAVERVDLEPVLEPLLLLERLTQLPLALVALVLQPVLAIAVHHRLLLGDQHLLRHPVLFLLVVVLGLGEVLAQQAMAVQVVEVAGILLAVLEIRQAQVHLKGVTVGLQILGT